jgi:hypothetical protein
MHLAYSFTLVGSLRPYRWKSVNRRPLKRRLPDNDLEMMVLPSTVYPTFLQSGVRLRYGVWNLEGQIRRAKRQANVRDTRS